MNTVYGVAASPDGTAAKETLVQGRLRPSLRMRAWTTPAAQIAKRQATRIPVDVGHSHDWIGEVTYLERRSGGLWVVAEVDDDVRPSVTVDVAGRNVEVEHDLYWSLERSGPAFPDIEILSVALTPHPARLAARPVTLLPGNINEVVITSHKPFERDLLKRAAEARLTRHGGPIIIHDPEAKIASADRLALASRTTGQLEYRSAQLADVEAEKREIELIIAPAESPAEVFERDRSYVEVFSYGAFAGCEEDPGRVRVNRDHKLERTVGVAVELDAWHNDGLVGTIRIAKTELGDESLELARAGCLDASAGFKVVADQWPERSVRRVTKATLHHVALTPDPAYTAARVVAVRDRSLAELR